MATEGATAAEAGVLQGNSATIGSNGVSGGVMVITLAQARALGYFAQGGNPVDAIDGYVGLGSGANYSFDPNNRAVAGAYDAIGVLEHEISEVLGRSAGLGQPLSDGTHAYSPLDLYRYTAPGQPSLTPGAGYISFDGGRTVSSPFNDPANGGDAGDWSTAVSGDAFDAFAQPGVALTLSSVDLREMEALGYSLSVPVDVIGSSDIITGVSPDGSVTNSGGVETVLATAAAADAIGMYSYNSNFNNAATIQVTSAMADAWGDFYTTNFTNQAGATLTVTAAHQAMGDLSGGGSFSNAGTMTVTGQTAYGEVGATSFTNSGTMTIIATGAGAKSIAVDISNPWGLSYTNSGTINADYAFLVDEHTNVLTIPGGQPVGALYTVTINNSGQINGIINLTDVSGQITNTGSITRAIQFGNFNSTYNGATGTATGGIYLGMATNTVTLGADGESVFGGGYADTITGGAGNDFIEIGHGNNSIDGGGGFNILSFADADMGVTVDLGAGTAAAGGNDTIKNIQEVIGSSYNDTIKAGAAGAELVGGGGNDTLVGGAGNDTLVAGTGGASMTGGGGNNTFVYSAGDHQAVVTDFGAGGDRDVLDIYGYSAAQSVQQQGADTLITLSASDTLLLKNVQAASLTSANLIFKTGTFSTGPAHPTGPQIYGSQGIEFTHDLTIAAGEVVNPTNVPVAFTDNTYGQGAMVGSQDIGGSALHSFDNKGTVNATTNTGDIIGLQTDLSAQGFAGEAFTNEAGAVFSVTNTSAAGAAYGFNTGYAPAINNAGSLTVSANGIAYGAWLGDAGEPFTNAATGVIRASSAGTAAYGLFFNASCKFVNNGQVIATGVGTAYGVMVTQMEFASFTNNGSITATATGPGAISYGVDIQPFAQAPVTLTNTGSITADVAITMPNINWAGPVTLVNSGTITGAINLQVGAEAESIRNGGHINGAIHFGDGTNSYYGAGYGAGGTQTGGIYLGRGSNLVTLANDGEQVFGGGGTDTITGGTGNDFIEIGRGQGSIDGGGGFNTLSLADADEGVTVNLGIGQVSFGGAYTVTNIQEVIGSSFNDTLIAGASAATLIAGSGHDTLVGGAGNDTLVAGAGGDSMTGGGGNNTFVYSAGDHQLVITDFGANGDHDVLNIDGYTSAQSVVQQGANTLITLSATDSILLDNVTATSLTGANLVYNSAPYHAASVPASPPIFLTSTAPIHALYAVSVYAGETLNIVSHTSDLNINQNIALWSSNGDNFANGGTINITSADDGLQGVAIGASHGPYNDITFTNSAGGTIAVTDTGGAANGVSMTAPFATLTAINQGEIKVNALTTATAVTLSGGGRRLDGQRRQRRHYGDIANRRCHGGIRPVGRRLQQRRPDFRNGGRDGDGLRGGRAKLYQQRNHDSHGDGVWCDSLCGGHRVIFYQ